MGAKCLCKHCGAAFQRVRPDANRQIYCSLYCRWAAKVVVPADVEACWLWRGAIATSGYGAIRVDGVTKNAHRLAIELHGGTIPDGMHALHSCDNRQCVNPLHLRADTPAANVDDVMKRRRHAWQRWDETQRREWVAKTQAAQRGRREKIRNDCAGNANHHALMHPV